MATTTHELIVATYAEEEDARADYEAVRFTYDHAR